RSPCLHLEARRQLELGGRELVGCGRNRKRRNRRQLRPGTGLWTPLGPPGLFRRLLLGQCRKPDAAHRGKHNERAPLLHDLSPWGSCADDSQRKPTSWVTASDRRASTSQLGHCNAMVTPSSASRATARHLQTAIPARPVRAPAVTSRSAPAAASPAW